MQPTIKPCSLCNQPMSPVQVKLRKYYQLWTCYRCTGEVPPANNIPFHKVANTKLDGLAKLGKLIDKLSKLAPKSLQDKYWKLHDELAEMLETRLKIKGHILLDNRVAIVKEDGSAPDGYIVYTVTELDILKGKISPLIYEAKRLGAKVSSKNFS